MPEQAFALKKYRCGTAPVTKIADNEHTLPSLGQSEVLSIQHSVGEAIPEEGQAPEEGTQSPSSVRGQDAGDVLPHHPAGPIALSDGKIATGELTTRVNHPPSESGDAEGLTRSSADENSWPCSVIECWPCRVLRDVAKVRHLWIMMGEKG